MPQVHAAGARLLLLHLSLSFFSSSVFLLTDQSFPPKSCFNKVSKQLHPRKGTYPKQVHGIVCCPNGHNWNRDILGAINIGNVHAWSVLGHATQDAPRPPYLARPVNGDFPAVDAAAHKNIFPCQPQPPHGG